MQQKEVAPIPIQTSEGTLDEVALNRLSIYFKVLKLAKLENVFVPQLVVQIVSSN